MAKYTLTAAALLAASAALASAAGTVVTTTDLSTDATYEDGSITYTASSGFFDGSSLFETVNSRYTAMTTVAVNLTALGISSDVTTLDSDTSILLVNYQTSSSSTTSSIGIVATETGLTLSWGGSAYFTVYYTYESLLEDSYTVDGDTYSIVTLVGAARTSSLTGAGLFDVDGSLANGIASTGLTTNAAYASIFVATDYIGAVSIYAGASTSDIATITAALQEAHIASVPEPSAFGLLAGIGALALVASRRRRR